MTTFVLLHILTFATPTLNLFVLSLQPKAVHMYERFMTSIADGMMHFAFKLEVLAQRLIERVLPIHYQQQIATWNYEWEARVERD